ncbi:MFS transporter [Arthrobacter sp. GMC3]|uniref:MFS transporter n=1 Tax=Arthrobacter sp. GMC3 TaxID=2058894 RepID=UPI000CE30AB4|nr:MFS transporter [Arthrobacter sp. GMC3]
MRRLLGAVSDPVLRILVTATLISRVGRGVFLTVTVLYITFVIGLSTAETATVLGISSAVGVGTSYLGGRLADKFSARRLLFALMAAEGLTLGCYAFASDFTGILIIACVVSAVGSASNATRMAIVARAFEGPARVNARSILRTVTNVAIALGAAIAGVALLADNATAYRMVMLGAGAVYLLGVIPVWKLPSRVNAPAPVTTDAASPAPEGRPQGGSSPFSDRRYLLLTALAAIFGMQFGLAEVGVPLWISHNTLVPRSLVSVLLILNTAIVIAFQIPLSRGTDDLRKASKVVTLAGVLMAVASILYALADGVSVAPAILLLVVAAIAHAFAEVWSQAGTWGLSFELANASNAGAYQGVFAMGAGLGSMCAPFVVAGTALKYGLPGWIALAVIFLASALGLAAIARRAARPAV